MKHCITARAAACMLTLGLAAGLAPVAAQAQTASDKWQWELAIYGWFPAIGGSTSFPSNGSSGPNIDVSAQDVIDALKMVFMGEIEARNGKWGVWSDLRRRLRGSGGHRHEHQACQDSEQPSMTRHSLSFLIPR